MNEAKIASQIEELQKHNSSLERRVRLLEQIQGSKGIWEGNSAAHYGDAIADAFLFDRDHRSDRCVYRDLYGLEYQQVLDYRTYTDGLFNMS